MTYEAAPGDVPVNIARPQWQCPHCLHNFHHDLDAATACAQAGPPPPAPDGVAVLVLPSHRGGGKSFGLSKAGPVRAETVDGQRRHRRDLTVDGTVVDARELLTDGTPATTGDLVVLANRRPAEPNHGPVRIGPSGYGLLDRLFRGERSYGRPTRSPVWVTETSSSGWNGATWWRAPDDAERAVLNMLTGDLLTEVAALDVDAYAAETEVAYRSAGYSSRQLGRRALASPAAALAVAAAHGAPSHIWALRWLSVHATDVARWQAHAAIAWAAGTGGPIPLLSGLRIAEKLPNNPGKKRLALMAPYETEDYHRAMRAVGDLLTVDAPPMPVPALGNVTAELRTPRKEVSCAQ